MEEKLTQKKLKEILHYNPDTGDFIRKKIAGTIDSSNGYRRIKIDGISYMASRLAFYYMEGYWPEHEMDHKNRNKIDDSWDNLRHATRQCNIRNRTVFNNNKSGITGVCWYRDRKKWGAQIRCNNKPKHLGFYKYRVDAARARWEAEKKYGYPNCNTTSSAYLYLKNKLEIK